MKWIAFILLFSVTCFAQLPVVPFVTQPASSSFSPTNVAGALLWVESTTAVTNESGTSPPSTGDYINRWGDLSGHHNDLFSNTVHTSEPNYLANGGPNSMPVIEYTNTLTKYMSNLLGNVDLSQPNTIFLVISNISGVPSTGTFFDSANGAARGTVLYYGTGPSYFMYAGQNSANLFPITLGSQPWWVVTFQYNSTSSLLRTNGVVSFSSLNPGTSAQRGFMLGNRFDAQSGYQTWAVAACLFYNAGLSSTDMHSVEAYLGNKFNITIY